MAKLIALIVFVLMFLAGIVLVALSLGIGLLLLIVGLLGGIAMGIVVAASGGFYTELGWRGFWHTGPLPRKDIEKHKKDAPLNVWDQMEEQMHEDTK